MKREVVFLYLMTSATQSLSKWMKCPSPQQSAVTKRPSLLPTDFISSLWWEKKKNYTKIIPNNHSFQINSSHFECQRATKESPFKRIKQTWRIIYDLIPICGILGVHKKSHWLLFKAWQIDGQLHISFPQNSTINHLWLELQQERKWWKNSQNLMGWMAATLQIPRLNTSKTYKSGLCSFAPMKTFCKAPRLWRPSAKLHKYEDLNHSSAILKNLGINANGYSWL